jgi:hypothetical protein
MNNNQIFEYVASLNIKHCDGILTLYNRNFICSGCGNDSLIVVFGSNIYINLFYINRQYFGFACSDSSEYSEKDIILSFYEIKKVLELADFNKYIEKYNSLILFK